MQGHAIGGGATPSSSTMLRHAGALGFALALAAAGGAVQAQTCQAQSGATATRLIELYTSEGCSSCPPADRWLSRLAADPSVVALAFHVDYWDRLGWKDRFASAAYTRRQTQQRAVNGARFIYTPQVVIDGVDRIDWPALGAPRSAAALATLQLTLRRDGAAYLASVQPGSRAPRRLAAFWSVTEASHVSRVQAGENHGATLRHDAVVRELQEVAPWSPRTGQALALRFEPAGAADPEHARRVSLVVLDAASGRPLQAIELAC